LQQKYTFTPFKQTMRRFFVKNLLFVIAVNVLVKPIWVFFIDRGVQVRVGLEAYGTYQALLNLSIIFQIVLDFGISSYNSRTIARDPDSLKDIFPSMLSARLVLIGIYMILGYSWGYIFGYRGWELILLVGVLMIQSLNALLAFIRSNVAALHRFKVDGILSVTDRLMMILVCGFLFFYPATAHAFKIQWFVIAQIVCYFIAAVTGYIVLRRIAKVHLKFAFQAPTVIKIIKQSMPYALLIFLMSVYNRSDSLMIERLCKPDGKEQAGIYAAAFRLLDMVNMFGLMFASMLLPLFGRMLAQRQNVQPIVKLCVNILLPMALMVSVGAACYNYDIMHLLYEKTADAYYGIVFAVVMGAFPAYCLMYVYSTLLTANGSLKALNSLALVGVIVNLSLNFYFIPHHKALGGAAVALVTQWLMAILFIISATRIIKLPINVKWTMAHIGYFLLIALLGYGVLQLHINWIVKLCGFGMVCVALMFVFGFVSISAIKKLANKEMDTPTTEGDIH